ncbi:polyketide cyclase / dehydrase and lipid transport [Crossiella sp. SN42]|uniref:polyketide cyclase / dehydrase and lipid transport n=1 Tax=Crossiella sp. SN42 TaxID=2944808 RepID=UPI00207D2F74|nr:polyketide cyclase / dehydrase and lipid transport [Crossiella sp. SN42]MCO1581698.1 polyketide cyclase / dehydrase and lipid transport [Crossiella sp. SN42]
MSSVDVVDELFITVPPSTLAASLADPASWRAYWPDLELTVYADRGAEGLRWTVAGALVGTMELWLEAVLDGTVVHYFLRAERPGEVPFTPREAQRETVRRQRAQKKVAFTWKDMFEAGRPVGVAP